MKNRIISLDLSRGFTVLFIAPIHAMLLFSIPSIRETWIGTIFRFIAEVPGAQLFMVLMGLSFYLKTRNRFRKVIPKIFILLFTGYLLNFLKFTLPILLGILPKQLITELEISPGIEGVIQSLLIGDIFHFAGIALVVLLALSLVFKNHILPFTFGILICFASPLFWDITSSNPLNNYLLALVGGKPPLVFFPLLPWLAYPLTGYVLGYFIKDGCSVQSFMPMGIIFIVIGSLTIQYFLSCTDISFYRTCPGHCMIHIGIVIVWLGIWEWFATRIKCNLFFELLKYLSRHITLLYIIQWLVIFFLLPFLGYQKLGKAWAIVVCVLIEINVLALVFAFNEMWKRRKEV